MAITDLDKLLGQVEKPARYTGGELNMILKPDAEVKFALCFPDVYEIGMSHLGSRILYNALNNREDTLCERSFAPWPDMEALMRAQDIPMFALESRRPLCEFDIIGFSLLYELCYTNILTMLELSGLALLAKERKDSDPLVLCGGPCTCNPEPIAPFMDAVCIGDGETMMGEVAEAVKLSKQTGESKQQLLLRLAAIPGVYVPAFYEPSYDNGRFTGISRIREDVPMRVTRRVEKDLEHAVYIGKPILPYLSIVHDRIALELFRGCTRGCRFCQAGFIYRPVRERSKETLMQQARELISCTGYDEISLFSLSSGDYSKIHELVPEIIDEFADKRVSVSLPSLRIDSFLKQDLERMQTVRKAGLTLAPEAGTQRLRDVINKCVTEEDLLRSVRDAFSAGWNSVKLYFMIGLPTETEEDILGIAQLARKVSAEFYSLPKEKRQKGLRLAVSASSFVPKPFTPFQWEPQNSKEELVAKQRLLKEALRGVRGAEFSYHAPDVSVLEGVFARGDRRIAEVLLYAHKAGARFDSWDDFYNDARWQEAFRQAGLNPADYAQRRRDTDEPLPWQHIDALVTTDYLKKELEKARIAACTKDCRQGCNGCFGEKYADYCKI